MLRTRTNDEVQILKLRIDENLYIVEQQEEITIYTTNISYRQINLYNIIDFNGMIFYKTSDAAYVSKEYDTNNIPSLELSENDDGSTTIAYLNKSYVEYFNLEDLANHAFTTLEREVDGITISPHYYIGSISMYGIADDGVNTDVNGIFVINGNIHVDRNMQDILFVSGYYVKNNVVYNVLIDRPYNRSNSTRRTYINGAGIDYDLDFTPFSYNVTDMVTFQRYEY